MKENNLNKAIKNLPVFEAPDVWNEIELALSNNKETQKFWLGFSLILILGITIFLISLSGDGRGTVNLNIQPTVDTLTATVNVDYLVTDSMSTASTSKVMAENRFFKYEFLNQNDHQNESEILTSEIVEPDEPIKPEVVGDILMPVYKTIVIYKDAGENLVPNPSFEDYNICPSGIVGRYERKLVPDWVVPSRGTPDYFNKCGKTDACVPKNFAGSARANSGVGYCGIILRKNFTRDNKITGEKAEIYREYIQAEFNAELVKGKKYRVKFYVCNSSNSRFAVDAIGAYISMERPKATHDEVLEFVPQIENPSGKYISNRDYWVAIEGIYEAQGGEKFITIGNFNNNFSTNYIMMDGKSDFNYAYYYIDDVSVVEVSESYDLVEDSKSNDKAANICVVGEF
jgi:hypothetical protein